MNFAETDIVQKNKVLIKNLLSEMGIEQVRKEITFGLWAVRAYISSKFFYDEVGSLLFEEITRLEEYYPTRTEMAILREVAPNLMNREEAFEVVELGSGDCSKISVLLEEVNDSVLPDIKYIPVDFSESAIKDAATLLTGRFPALQIHGYVADFIHQMDLIPHSEEQRIISFLGSTIGNFSKNDAKEIVCNLAKGIYKNDTLLIGFDLVKPQQILHSAYNDTRGVTARFNKNILNVVNKIMQSDFCEEDFEHFSYFNAEKSRIEMYLKAKKNVEVRSPFWELPFKLGKGESIHTENSHKYTPESILNLIEGTGLSLKKLHTDKNNWFAVVEFERKI